MRLPLSGSVIGALLGMLTLANLASANPLNLKVSGDARVRIEEDWDSVTSSAVPRPNRARSRIRARLAASSKVTDDLTLTVRARTGGKGSQQNANVTFADFSGNPTERLGVTFDQFEMAWKTKSSSIELGRMPFPFFTQNEYMWDADINPLGLAASTSLPLGGGKALNLAIGHFALPVGLAGYSGKLTAGQLVYSDPHTTLAGGIFHIQPSRTDPNRLTLLDGNGEREYTVLALNARYSRKLGKLPASIGADLFRNFAHYSDPADPVGFTNYNQRTGYVLSAALGDNAKSGHLQIGYRYFHIERLAVNASYSHDDVSRFGVPSQAANSDLAGHDIYANYVVNKHVTVGLRTMLVHRLTNSEKGKRARLDMIFSF